MIDIDIINGTIAEWEAKDLTFVVVERLAWLYIVRDHAIISSGEEKGQEIITMPSVAISSGSEFMEVCSKEDASKVWRVLDELMSTLEILQPKLYRATIDQIKE